MASAIRPEPEAWRDQQPGVNEEKSIRDIVQRNCCYRDACSKSSTRSRQNICLRGCCYNGCCSPICVLGFFAITGLTLAGKIQIGSATEKAALDKMSSTRGLYESDRVCATVQSEVGETFANESAARAAGANRIYNCGACGACSTAHDYVFSNFYSNFWLIFGKL